MGAVDVNHNMIHQIEANFGDNKTKIPKKSRLWMNAKSGNRHREMVSKNTIRVLNCVLIIISLMSIQLYGCAGGIKIGAPQAYYSVHLESFKEIKNANRYVNDLTHKGKFVFWKIAYVEGVKFHRVFVGRFNERTDAEAYRFKLKSEFAEKEPNKPLKIHEFRETQQITPSHADKPQLPSQSDRHE